MSKRGRLRYQQREEEKRRACVVCSHIIPPESWSASPLVLCVDGAGHRVCEECATEFAAHLTFVKERSRLTP